MKVKVIPRHMPLPAPKPGVTYVYEKAPKRHGKGSYRGSRYDNLVKVQTHRPPKGAFDAADSANDTKHRSHFYCPDRFARSKAPKDRKPMLVVKVPADQPMPRPKKGTIYVR